MSQKKKPKTKNNEIKEKFEEKENVEQPEEGLEEHIEEVGEDISEDMFSDFMRPTQFQFTNLEPIERAEAPVLSRVEVPNLEQDVSETPGATSATAGDNTAPGVINYIPTSITDYATRGIGMEEEFRKYMSDAVPPPILTTERDIRSFRPELLNPSEQMGIRHQAEIEPRTIDGERARERNRRRRLPFEGEDIEKKYREVRL